MNIIKLCAEIVIRAPQERCFNLARSIDLHRASSQAIDGRAVGGRTTGLAELGDQTRWSARFFGLRFSLVTEITYMEHPHGFCEIQCAGPFRRFGHVYRFLPVSATQTIMTDEFSFQSPFGVLGTAFDSLALRHRMKAALDVRTWYLKSVAETDEWRMYLRKEVSA